jgi:hypothetical protein
VAARFLVGCRREQDVPAEPGDRVACRIAARGTGLGGEEPYDRELHRERALHVDRAAPPDVAVGDITAERIVGPALRRGRDDVEMGQEEQRLATGAVAAQPRADGSAAGERLDDLRLEAGHAEGVGDVRRRGELGAGRIGRIDGSNADEVAERLDELRLSAGEHFRRDPVRRSDGDAHAITCRSRQGSRRSRGRIR